MEQLRLGVVLAVASVSTAIVNLGLRWWTRHGELAPRLPLLLAVLLLVTGAVVLLLAHRVRSFVRGKRDMEPIAAARVVALTMSAAYVGAIGAGVALGFGLLSIGYLDAPAPREAALTAGITLLAAIGCSVAGVVGQRWCRVPEDKDRGSSAHGDRPPAAS